MAAKLPKLDEGDIALIFVPEKRYELINSELIADYVAARGFYCVYISLNRPFISLAKTLKEQNIDMHKILIIDAVTPISGNIMRNGNAVFVGSPKALTHLSITTTSTLKNKRGEKRILILDSLSVLISCNGVATSQQFMRFVISKMQEWNVTMAIFMLEGETDKNVVSELSSLCNKTFKA